ncbi:transcriptional regulator, SarA/Rot family [Staphylococcus kloosii]|jgi:DNA-binding MarR family transcriptional regulator|uniref:transcriptional regulator, SarA/Rot family n=1 Tax=Staphylococcus kloosii TaxID=29384 RepID=UPI00189DB531|nr:MarR family transcriptional regulator [Staphylococcus kloosii]MBF7023430.1 MarR family transcriptional regulator [Staphylococcus kloosii]
MNIIKYEEKRTLIKKVVKQNLNITLVEIVILDKIAEINKTRIEASELKKSLYNKNTPISSQLSNLISLKLLKKERDLHDERRIYLYDIDLVGINKILQQYHSIVSKLIAAT